MYKGDLVKFIEDFDTGNPDWSRLPKGFPGIDTDRLTSAQIGKLQAIKTIYEMHKPIASPKSSSYTPKSPFRIRELEKTERQAGEHRAYRYSPLYRNAVILEIFVNKLIASLDGYRHKRYIEQIESAMRSVVANIQEGYLRPSTKELLDFLGFAHGSLEEVRGDIERAKDTGKLKSRPGSDLKSIGIILRRSPILEGDRRDLGGDRDGLEGGRSGSGGYPGGADAFLETVKNEAQAVEFKDLSYEIFIELINKTNWLFNKVTQGLRKKIADDKKDNLNNQLKNHWEKHY